MFTRQSRVTIDFDEASKAWNLNKKKLENGCYHYSCKSLTKSGENCKNTSLAGSDYCHLHLKKLRSKL
jgi:hypothetical protein